VTYRRRRRGALLVWPGVKPPGYGVALGIGVDHPNYQAAIPAVGAATREALVADLA